MRSFQSTCSDGTLPAPAFVTVYDSAKVSPTLIRSGITTDVTRRSGAGRSTTSIGLTVVLDRKSTRLNSSHVEISYAVFCLKKKKHFYCLSSSHTTTKILKS